MELKNIFKMVKANRYTQDGRDELAKLQETEDVKYKTGDISQKTGLQKQPDGSWAPPKKGGAGAGNEYYKNDVRTEAGEKKILSETKTEVLQSKIKDLEETKKKNGGKLGVYGEKSLQLAKEELAKRSNPATEGLESKSTEELTNLFNELATKSVREKSPENSAERDRVYKELKRRQKAETNQTKAKFDEYGLPDEKTISMKDDFLKKENVADPNKLTNAEFNALAKKLDSELGIGNMERAQELLVTSAENPDYPFKPKTSEERAERAKFEKDRDDFIERMNAYREESNQWTKRAKGERTATLVDWLDDWDKHPEEKSDAAYAAIEKELASRGVNRAGRQDEKKADNAGRNEFYRRAYEGDAAPRQLTGDCRIRIRKEKPKLTGDTKIRIQK